MTQTLTEYLATRGERTTYQAIVDLDQHRCDYANCEQTATDLVTVRVYRGVPSRQTSIIELRGVCHQHVDRFALTDPGAVNVRPTVVVVG